MKERYIYPAIFTIDDDGITIDFPDLQGCLPCALNMEQAVKNAKEAMALHLCGMKEDNDEILEPSALESLQLEPNQRIFVVEAWMPSFRDKIRNKAVNKFAMF
ncbi:MAG: type II toxin-antitoxin system HicB family antitoxin [Bacillota bacterium]